MENAMGGRNQGSTALFTSLMCVYPFQEGGPLSKTGYRFRRGSPLYECSLPNFDFLIHQRLRKGDVAIFGEVKGSIASPGSVLSEVRDRRHAVLQNLLYIKEKYLKVPKEHPLRCEFVIGTNSFDAQNMLNAAITAQDEVVVWHGPTTGPQVLGIAFPPTGLEDARRWMHADKVLNQAMQKVPTSRRCFNFFPQSHPVDKLKTLIPAARIGSNQPIVEKDRLRAILEKDMFYLEQPQIEAETGLILEEGKRIGFLFKDSGPDEFPVTSRARRADSLAEDITEKWIERQIERQKEKVATPHIEGLRQKLIDEGKKRPAPKTLADFS